MNISYNLNFIEKYILILYIINNLFMQYFDKKNLNIKIYTKITIKD